MNGNNYEQVNTQPVKKKSGWSRAWLYMVIAGIIMMIVGAVVMGFTDLDKYSRVKNYHNVFSIEDISSLDIDIGYGELELVESSDNSIHIDCKNVHESFSAKNKNGTLTVSRNGKRGLFGCAANWDLSFFGVKSRRCTVTIALPKKELDRVLLDMGAGTTSVSSLSCGRLEVECGAGEVSFTDISCGSADIDCGAGEVTIRDMSCQGKLSIDGGTGEITISDSVLGGIDLDQGVGEFTFTGTINGDIDADGGIGEMSFRLTNPESDFSGGKYRISIDNGIGKTYVSYNN